MLRCALIGLLTLCASLIAYAQPQASSVGSIEFLIRSQHYDQALELAQSTLQETPANFRVWTLEGIIFSMQGRTPEAEAAFEKALSLSPNYPAALKAQAQLLYQAKDKRAIPLLEKLLTVEPGDTTAREMLAISEGRQADCQAAINTFASILDSIQTHPESLESYGSCLVRLKQREKAIPVFQQLAALLPGDTYPKYDLALLLVLTKAYQEALDVLSPFLQAAHPDADVLSLASEAYEALHDTPHAVPLLRQAIALNPGKPDNYVFFATLCMDHDSFQTGVDMLNAGIARIPGNAALYISRGLLYAQLAQYEKAEDDFKRAEQFDTGSDLSAYAADLTELQRNHSKETIPTIRAQVKLHPSNALFQYLLAKTIMEQGATPGSAALDEATRAATEAVRLKPDLVAARDILAGIYISDSKSDLAIEQCRAALVYQPDDQTAIFHLIVALRHSGHTEEIQALAKRLSDLKQRSRQKEDEIKRYRLVEEQAPAP